MHQASRIGKAPTKGAQWLISYVDMTMILLCFMILLTSLAVVDENRKQAAIKSVSKIYATSTAALLPVQLQADNFAQTSAEGKNTEGIEGTDESLSAIKSQIAQADLEDIDFQENKFVQIVSMSEALMFEPNSTVLSKKGEQALDRILPYLIQAEHPVLIAGHTSSRLDEEGSLYSVGGEQGPDPTWILAHQRARAVYQYLQKSGALGDTLTIEAFGQHKPRYGVTTPKGRKRNRRVELIIDKRNEKIVSGLKNSQPTKVEQPGNHSYKGFDFTLDMPGEESPLTSPLKKNINKESSNNLPVQPNYWENLKEGQSATP